MAHTFDEDPPTGPTKEEMGWMKLVDRFKADLARAQARVAELEGALREVVIDSADVHAATGIMLVVPEHVFDRARALLDKAVRDG